MKIDKPLSAAQKRELELQQQLETQHRKTSVWTREKVNQLIELYKKHECLWNHWHEAYKNKDKRNRAIQDICTTLNVPKFEFGKKIHNLRNQFNTEMKKLEQRIEEAGVNTDDANDTELRCKWSHFESLMFLRNVIEPRPGGYQTKKIRLKFDYNNTDDEVNVTTILPSSCGSSNTTNPDDVSHFQYENNVDEEVITDDFQSFENEVVEVDQTNGREVCDHKYQPQQNQELPSASTNSSTKFANSKKPSHSQQTSSTCSSSQTDVINVTEGPPIIELNSNNVTVVPTYSSSTTTPIISSITSTNSSNRPTTILHDQWDAFGELVANEFRNLNSEISRKRLKRKIMQAMLEVGEEDDHILTSRSISN